MTNAKHRGITVVMNREPLRENEQKIITLISANGPLTKKEMASMGDMGWATVVKMTTRLMEKGILYCPGTSDHKDSLGKNAYIYDLVSSYPLFIGIDVEYSTTTIILTNLKYEMLCKKQFPTSHTETEEVFLTYLESIVLSVTDHMDYDLESVLGIGVGIPTWLFDDPAFAAKIRTSLENRFSIPVQADNSVHAYTLYKEHKVYKSENFTLLTIRRGIGMGIIYRGELFTGEDGLAGEIGHLRTGASLQECRCGGIGCLETQINEITLYQKVQAILSPESRIQEQHDQSSIRQTLDTWLSEAENGNPPMAALAEETAGLLSDAIASVILILNIRNIMLVAPFGEKGTVLTELIRTELSERIFGPERWSLTYRDMHMDNFSKGAALFVMRGYFNYTV
jgi:predicted NBD/HSP70 family sugar kinase